MITIIAKFSVCSDKIEEFKKYTMNVVRETRKEKGNLAYKIYQARDDASRFTFIEEWLNDAVIEEHNNSKHFLKFMNEIKHITNGEASIEQLTTVPSVFR